MNTEMHVKIFISSFAFQNTHCQSVASKIEIQSELIYQNLSMISIETIQKL